MIAGLYIIPNSGGKTVELPDGTAAMLGYDRAPSLEQTSFGSQTAMPTLSLRKLPTASEQSTGPGDACKGLASRVTKYGDLDPIPAIRTALIAKGEEQQRGGGGVRAVASLEEADPIGKTDPKLLIAAGAAVLVIGAIVIKKMKKR